MPGSESAPCPVYLDEPNGRSRTYTLTLKSYALPRIPTDKRCSATVTHFGSVCPSLTRKCKETPKLKANKHPTSSHLKLRVAAHSDRQTMQRHSDSLWLSVPQSDSQIKCKESLQADSWIDHRT